METNPQATVRSIDVTGLSEEAIRAVEALVVSLRESRSDKDRSDQEATGSASFEQGLSELSEGLQTLVTLPDDFSRADIYGEHP